jgi:hypothetical protein
VRAVAVSGFSILSALNLHVAIHRPTSKTKSFRFILTERAGDFCETQGVGGKANTADPLTDISISTRFQTLWEWGACI